VSHVANPGLDFDTPSRKIEFYSEQAARLGLPTLPSYDAPIGQASNTWPAARAYPLALAQGRTLTHFHSFYNNGQELPTLARREAAPTLWISPADAATRQLADGAAIRIFNERGALMAQARVTDRIPAGTVWMRDGWPGLNGLTAGVAVLPDAAVDLFAFSAGQATFDAMVEVAPA
jgi:anaerobic selenocysteine-containing dehydrogenase